MSDDGIVPALFGIDPDVLYHWTPREGRAVIAEAVYEGEGESAKEIAPKRWGAALDGAPMVMLAPLMESDYLALDHARAAYRRERAKRLAAGDTADDLTVFSDELVSKTLRASVKGIKIKGPGGRDLTFSGEWEKDEVKIRRWRGELFYDIVSANAYETEDVSGFTSPQGSGQA